MLIATSATGLFQPQQPAILNPQPLCDIRWDRMSCSASRNTALFVSACDLPCFVIRSQRLKLPCLYNVAEQQLF